MPDTPQKKFYLTTPIYYVNARPHIGHAYSTIAADVIARRHRLLGDDTFLLTGTDEHGQKVQRSAEKAGIPPQQFADEVSATFRDLWKRMGITNNDYIRTTEERHKRGVQKLFARLYEKDHIYLSSYTGSYCVSDEAFVDLPAGTPCPDCGRSLETVTEENFFFRLSHFQHDLLYLIHNDLFQIPSSSSRNEVTSFLIGDFSGIFDEYQALTEANPSIGDTVGSALTWGQKVGKIGRVDKVGKSGIPLDEPLYYVKGALKDLSVSRSSFTWGIPVPEDVQRAAGAKQNHVVYVWLDALANYITAIGYGSDDPADKAKFEKYWPADLHLVGKEITRFHCVYWPAFLMAAGIALPKSVVANGWLLFEESKMSKSRGNVVRTETILDAFGPLCPPVLSSRSEGVILSEAQNPGSSPEAPQPLAVPTKAQQNLFAADVLRYFLLREIPFGQDGSFSFDALITRYNADLANGYGNLVSRTLKMIEQYCDGKIPEGQSYPLTPFSERGKLWTWESLHWLDRATVYPNPGQSAPPVIGETDFSRIAELLLGGVAQCDSVLTQYAPWKMIKDDARRNEVPGILRDIAESIRIITALLYPVMPYATASVWRQLGLGDIEEAARTGELKNLQWGGLKPGTKLGPLAPIFPRADKGLAQIMTDMENPAAPPAPEPTPEAKASEPTAEALNAVSPATSAPAAAPGALDLAPGASAITIDDFAKIDLRVAQIVVAERIPKADKLLRLEVDLGTERRQILSGIAEFYTPEELIGKRIAIIANLAPRKMRGLESHGMLLAASGEDHSSKPILATFSDEIALGSKIR